jgi:ATP-dependent HslUV protease ATP-binding subunit HslU
VKQEAVLAVEQNGIVFLDEIDKIATRSDSGGADVSRQGVQRDLLPLVEGHDGVHQVRHDQDRPHPVHRQRRVPSPSPSDLIPEMQGRFPIRVELESLSVGDFECILTSDRRLSDACSIRPCWRPTASELDFTPDGIRRLAEVAWSVNERPKTSARAACIP